MEGFILYIIIGFIYIFKDAFFYWDFFSDLQKLVEDNISPTILEPKFLVIFTLFIMWLFWPVILISRIFDL